MAINNIITNGILGNAIKLVFKNKKISNTFPHTLHFGAGLKTTDRQSCGH